MKKEKDTCPWRSNCEEQEVGYNTRLEFFMTVDIFKPFLAMKWEAKHKYFEMSN